MSKEAYLCITLLQEASVFKIVSLVGVEFFATPGDFFQQFLPNSFKAVRGTFWSELIFYFFYLKKLEFYRSTCFWESSKGLIQTAIYRSRRAIPGNFFFRRKFRKGNWVLKSGPLGLKFRQSSQNSIRYYKTINLQNWKDFSWENFSFVFFSVFGLEAWNFVFLSAIASRLSKRVPKNNPRKTFFCTRKEKKWHLSDIFPSFRQNRSSACVKIQHSTLPNEQLVGKKNILRIFSFSIFVFTLGGQNLVHLGQNRSRLSNCVPKTSPMKRCLWIIKQEEEIGNWANFSRTVSQEFRRGY